ncbi:MAG: hypothetical protein Q9177_002730 [Variospora cf. flavescens]
MAFPALYGSRSVLWQIYLKDLRDPLLQCLAPRFSRSMATETALPGSDDPPMDIAPHAPLSIASSVQRRTAPKQPDVLTTIYRFPSMEPQSFAYYPANKLHLPLRRDILHRAVIFEGDATRQGTASTKWRKDVHGSGRKLRPQKGTGRARLGDKKSPSIRGGGVAFGPHPRDFSTDLPRKIYDLAWRTALSYRYRRGQLIVLEDGVEIEMDESRWLAQIMNWNHIGKSDGGSLLVARKPGDNLSQAFFGIESHGRLKTEEDVDVKDLLKAGRIMIEKRSLDALTLTVELVLTVETIHYAPQSQNHESCLPSPTGVNSTSFAGTPLQAPMLIIEQQMPDAYAEFKEQPGDDPDDVHFNTLYGVRTIQLNRPKKYNALNGSMIRKIIPRLQVSTPSAPITSLL